MDVTGFLCASLGSSTVHLHDSLLVDAHSHVHKLVSVVNMVTVLEEYSTEEQRPVVCFLCAEELNAKDINKKMLPVYDEKCLTRKAVHNWV
jgi:hypothetical protein